MEYTQIGNSDKKASRIGLGTWSMGGWMWGGSDDTQALQTIRKALDLGINVIDTAPIYAAGHSEQIVGQALKDYGQRDDIVLVTKTGLIQDEKGAVYRKATKEHITQEIEDSLRRLKTDYIDLYLIHWPDPHTPVEETATIMHKLVESGKVRAMGLSNHNVKLMEEFAKYGPVSALQSPYNMYERGIESDELPYCRKNHITVMGYGALCRGLLTGSVTADRKYEGDDLRNVDPKFQTPKIAEYVSCSNALKEWVKEAYNKSLAALSVRWCLDMGVDIPLWGARKPHQLDIVPEVWDWKLTAADMEKIDAILNEHITEAIGPEFMQPSLDRPKDTRKSG